MLQKSNPLMPPLLISILSAFLMLLISYVSIKYDLVGDEKILTQWSSRLSPQPTLQDSNFVFVNVKNDKQLISISQDVGKVTVTDRRLLTYFFRFLSEYNAHQFLLCDVYFDKAINATDTLTKPYDDSLRLEIQATKRLLVAGIPNQDFTALLPQVVGNVPMADASLNNQSRQVFKWQLWHKSLPTMPVAMYEAIEQKKLPAFSFQEIHPSFYIRNQDLEEAKYPHITSLADFEDLVLGGEALKEVRKEFYDTYFKGKIIILGDFSANDELDTSVGKMYGSLVLLNTYLSLKAGKANISLLWLGLILLVFAGLSYHALYVTHLDAPAWLLPVVRFPLFRFFDYLLVGLALSFVSFWLFGIHLSVILIFVYLKGIRYLRLGGRLKQLEKDLFTKNQENEKLLHSIMPQDVAEELKKTGKTKIRKFESATILFADVKGFSKKAQELKETKPATAAEDLIDLLDDTFSEMDTICKNNGLERIKTIGDCYMAVAGVPIASKTHALDTAMAALAIQKWMADEKQKRNGDFWEVRLGMHTGELVAGVVGTQRYAYDVWGADVNVASRMESGGEIGKVNTTEYTKSLIEDFFEFEYREEIEAKNIGMIKAYFIKRIKPELSADTAGFEPNEQFRKLKKERFGS